jgi:hypothetical protein
LYSAVLELVILQCSTLKESIYCQRTCRVEKRPNFRPAIDGRKPEIAVSATIALNQFESVASTHDSKSILSVLLLSSAQRLYTKIVDSISPAIVCPANWFRADQNWISENRSHERTKDGDQKRKCKPNRPTIEIDVPMN